MLRSIALPPNWSVARVRNNGRLIYFRIVGSMPRRRDIRAVGMKLLLIMKRQGM